MVVFLDALEINGRRLQLLNEAVPRLSRVVALWDTSVETGPVRATEIAARSLGLHIQTVAIRSPKDLDAAFRTATREHADGVVLLGSALMRFHLEKIVNLALQRRLPTVAHAPHYAQGGVLLGYGPDVGRAFQQAESFMGPHPQRVPARRATDRTARPL